MLTWLPSRPEVSEYDVGAALTFAYDVDPRSTFEDLWVRESDPEKNMDAVGRWENRARPA